MQARIPGASHLPSPPAVFPQRSGRGSTTSTASLRMTNICRPSGSFGWPSVRPSGKTGRRTPSPHVLPRRRRRGRRCLSKQRLCYSKDSLTGLAAPMTPHFRPNFQKGAFHLRKRNCRVVVYFSKDELDALTKKSASPGSRGRASSAPPLPIRRSGRADRRRACADPRGAAGGEQPQPDHEAGQRYRPAGCSPSSTRS